MDLLQTITVEELKSRLDAGDKPLMIDVREDEEVADGMIPGAIHLPMGEIPGRIDEIPREGEVIFICRSGNRSGKVCEYLQMMGYENQVNLTGGMLAWAHIS